MFPDAEAMPAHDPVTVIVKLLLFGVGCLFFKKNKTFFS